MITPEDPPGLVVRTEAQKAAADHGFVHNGLLLSALWDGAALASPALAAAARAALDLDRAPHLAGLHDAHRTNLARHGFP